MAMRLVTSIDALAATIAQSGGRIRKAMNDQLEAEALAVQRIARDMVPVDAGDMERAIKINNGEQRRKWIVYVDENEATTPGKRGGAFTVGDYANWLHDGSYNLGKKSQAKAERVAYLVGPKFLERALRERTGKGLVGRLTAAARRLGILN